MSTYKVKRCIDLMKSNIENENIAEELSSLNVDSTFLNVVNFALVAVHTSGEMETLIPLTNEDVDAIVLKYTPKLEEDFNTELLELKRKYNME